MNTEGDFDLLAVLRSQESHPAAVITAFAYSGVNLEPPAWTKDPARRLAVQTALNLAIYRAVRDAGIQIPCLQREIRVVGTQGEIPQPR